MVFLLSGCGEADSGNPEIEVSEALGLMAEKEENRHIEAEKTENHTTKQHSH